MNNLAHRPGLAAVHRPGGSPAAGGLGGIAAAAAAPQDPGPQARPELAATGPALTTPQQRRRQPECTPRINTRDRPTARPPR